VKEHPKDKYKGV